MKNYSSGYARAAARTGTWKQSCSAVAMALAVQGAFAAGPARAGSDGELESSGPCGAISRADCGQVNVVRAGENTEKSTPAENPSSMGFSISVDGERLAGDDRPVDETRRTDRALSDVDIQVKFDGLDVKPRLNIATTDLRHSYRAGERIAFNVTTNYPSWIDRAELRIFAKDGDPKGRPLDVVPVGGIGEGVAWDMPAAGPELYMYVLRVYDRSGRFDETVPLTLRRTDRAFEPHAALPEGPPFSAGREEDRTAFRNIPVHGGAVTVFGRNIPQGYGVRALGESIPVDAQGAFLAQRILPPGEHAVEIDVAGERDGRISFSRDVNIPENDWFYVALADFTVGQNLGSKAFVETAPGEYEDIYSKGRLAFYLKGKIKGQYLLTASADTGEDKVQNMFRNFDSKGPQELLRRIDPDRYYPVYGDDSTAIEDAPTDGKFYVRLERNGSHVMWGKYKTTINGTEFARNERKLYGGHGRYQSETSTSHGVPQVEAEAYASKPDTLPRRDVLLGTGGSVYFLSRQDVNRGSETVSVEVRDLVSDTVLSRTPLQYGIDYEINYVQGVVLLKKPLASTTRRADVISDGALSGNRQFLTVQYEFTPAFQDIKGYSSGGRLQGWVSDHVRLGLTGLSEQTGDAAQNVQTADVHVRLHDNSFVEAEAARSEGPGFQSAYSINGGLTINGAALSGEKGRSAYADRAKLHLDLADFGLANKGAIGAFYERRDSGFSSLGYDTAVDQQTYGALADLELRDDLRLKLLYKDFENDLDQKERDGGGELEYAWLPDWSVAVGVKHKELSIPGVSLGNGGRTDTGVKLTHAFSEDAKAYVFGQGTVSRSGDISRNDRGGVGTEFRLTEKIGLSGEVSYGTLGWGGLAALTYDPTPDDRNYFGYTLDPERTLTHGHPLIGSDRGRFVVGARHKYSEAVSAYAENNYDMFGVRQTLTSTYGVVYTPTPVWNITGGVEYGDVNDRFSSSTLERIAPSIAVGYRDEENVSWRLKGEARFEDSVDVALDRTTYLFAGGLSVAINDDWRFLAGLDAAISESDQASFLDGDYIKGSVGYAYRPVHHDWLNGLFKFIYLDDLPGPDQVNSAGNRLGPAQRSYILSADGSFDVHPLLTLGAKYGFRIGEVSYSRSSDDFERASAHLGVLRADLHVVKSWDLMGEVRLLHTPEIDTSQFGFVTAVYRHVGEEMKVGVGYNFGRFSDDVGDLTHDDGGVFLNVVGKF